MMIFGSTSALEPVDLVSIVVPTVAGRESELSECLASIRNQRFGSQVDLLVSGNGTSRVSSDIAGRFGARFTHRDFRLSAWEHVRLVLSEVTRHYTWLVADDDVLAPGALDKAIGAIEVSRSRGKPLDAFIGRAQFFSQSDFSDVGPVTPDSDSWTHGSFTDLGALSGATSGIAHIGAFFYRSDLFSFENYDRYIGTSHELFGAFWDGLAQVSQLSVWVESEPLIYLRQGPRQWDYSPIETLLGLRNFDRLLPEPVSRVRVGRSDRLTIETALYYASLSDRNEKPAAFALAEFHGSKAPFALNLIHLPSETARNLRQLIFWSRKQLKRLRKFAKFLRGR